ncbi:MAG: hypothetical protein JW746_00900 [Candidatus Krumholzibacteriota bacterium]|nr:hypothetical protein [Candidatus Krumholzibacteriota bacterium]
MRRSKAQIFLTSITFLSVLAAMGCGTNSPVTPSQDDTLPGVENPLFVQLTASSGSSSLDLLASSPGTIVSAEKGGIVTNGYYTLYFPPGALDEDTEITIEMPRFPEAVVELGPHGIQFNKPVTMSLSHDMVDSDVDSFIVYWFNEDSGLWENIGGETSDQSTTVALEHFSEYGHAPEKL